MIKRVELTNIDDRYQFRLVKENNFIKVFHVNNPTKFINTVLKRCSKSSLCMEPVDHIIDDMPIYYQTPFGVSVLGKIKYVDEIEVITNKKYQIVFEMSDNDNLNLSAEHIITALHDLKITMANNKVLFTGSPNLMLMWIYDDIIKLYRGNNIIYIGGQLITQSLNLILQLCSHYISIIMCVIMCVCIYYIFIEI